MTVLRAVLLRTILCLAGSVPAQAPSAPAPTTDSSGPPPQAAASSPNKTKSKLIPSFLIIGTVFNENALSFPGVQVRIRRAGERKFRWETYTDARGEFAVRVPPGFDYEVVTHVKKYQDSTQSVDSKVDVQQRLSIKLETLAPKNGVKS